MKLTTSRPHPRRRRPWAVVLSPLAAALLAACTGIIGSEDDVADGPDIPPSTPTDFNCDPNAVPEALPLRRLSDVQYRNTLRDLVTYALPAESTSVMAEIEFQTAQLVADVAANDGGDQRYAKFSRLDQTVQQAHIDTGYYTAEAVGAALTNDPTRTAAVIGDCATDADPANDDVCLDDFIRRFGERALRRPITDEDVTFYRDPAGTAPFEAADYADVIALLLNAPHFRYFVEHGQGGFDEDAVAPLEAYELASRLSYHFWQSMPDDALFAAARSGELLSAEGYQAQVERIFNDPRTTASLETFFGEWLQNSTLEPLDSRVGSPAFDTMRGTFAPTPTLREEMWQEVVDSATYYTEQGGTFEDFFRSNRSFAKTPELASIYGVEPWTSGEPPTMDDPARAGLITRAAYLATGSANTRPVMKGVFIRRAILCDPIPPPPPEAENVEIELPEDASTREYVDALTGGGSCGSCHTPLINPLGFATENFDALGRKRDVQVLIDPATGDVIGEAELDTEVVPLVETTDARTAADAVELAEQILESPKPYACFTRQYFRYTFGRMEDLDRDACALADVKRSLDEGASLSEVLRTVALSDSFKQRSFDTP